MKTNFKWMALLMIPAVLAGACSKDEDDIDGPVDTSKLKSNAVITTGDDDQVLCTKVGYTEIAYNSDNFATRINDYLIRYDEGVIFDRYDDTEYKMTMNSMGFISQLSWSEKHDDEEYSGTANFEYYNSGLLSKIIVNAKEIDDIDDSYYNYKCSEEWTSIITLNWNGDNIKSVKLEETSTHKHTGSESFTEKEKYIDNYYVNDSRKNILRQYNYGYGEMIDSDVLEELVYAGLLGKAPGNLPTEVTNEWDDQSDDSYYNGSGSIEYSYSFKFNGDGTIRCETEMNEYGSTHNINYSYTSANGSRSEIVPDATIMTNPKSRRPHKHDIIRRR